MKRTCPNNDNIATWELLVPLTFVIQSELPVFSTLESSQFLRAEREFVRLAISKVRYMLHTVGLGRTFFELVSDRIAVWI